MLHSSNHDVTEKDGPQECSQTAGANFKTSQSADGGPAVRPPSVSEGRSFHQHPDVSHQAEVLLRFHCDPSSSSISFTSCSVFFNPPPPPPGFLSYQSILGKMVFLRFIRLQVFRFRFNGVNVFAFRSHLDVTPVSHCNDCFMHLEPRPPLLYDLTCVTLQPVSLSRGGVLPAFDPLTWSCCEEWSDIT